MGFNLGIVGLPNVGKSTLFNALLETQAAEAANYPFCTIEPNTGRVGVPDKRLDTIAGLAGSATIIPTQLEFVDIAGLVRGASKGEGLGNQFLANIRETDAVAYVLRCFEDGDVTHVEGNVDPLRDAQIIETELALSDLESVEKRLPNLLKRAQQPNDKEARALAPLMARVAELLAEGKPARLVDLADEHEEKLLRQMQLLTAKPVLYIANVDEASAASGNELSKRVQDYAAQQDAPCVIISARIEAELAGLSAEEKQEYLSDMGLKEPGLHRVIEAGYGLLGLLTFFTAGPKEARAWTVRNGAKAPEAAGVIHTDFEKGFIRAETIAYADFVACGGEAKAKEAGKLRLEGKEYTVRDGDILHFRFNV